ncbi:MAG TPA: RNA polymerase sigma factor, partial [Polyangiaceae bacterium]|nr:RNA polymerase sigma factor [Polyangiaceae bacterium]
MAEFQRLLATGSCSPFADVEVPNEARLERRDVEDAAAPSQWSGRVDTDLLDDCVDGDEFAWQHLHRLCYPRAAAFLRKLGVTELDLEDAVQDVFVQLFRYLPSFRRESELSTWLYRICISQARSVRRRKRVTQTLARLLSLGTAPTLVSTPSLPEAVVRRRVEAALSKMSEGDRTVFVLYEMEGVPGKRIAEIVDSPEASVWRRLHGARQVFRRALEA